MNGRRLRICAAACLALAGGFARAQTPPPPHWRVGDAPPSIEGIHLGDSEAAVTAVLGAPAPAPPGVTSPAAALHALRYRGSALIIGISSTAGVVRILLRKPEGGALDGIRVGDRLGRLVARWGDPPAGHGSTGRYPMGDWTVSVRADMGTNVVLSILLARTPPHPAPPPPKPVNG